VNVTAIRLGFRRAACAAVCATLLISACSGSPEAGQDKPTAWPTPAGAASGVPVTWSHTVDPAAIPLGDDKVSSEPLAGSLYSCKVRFAGRGAPHDGPWIDEADHTWDATAKPQVEGANSWPQARYQESVSGDVRVVSADNLPIAQVTGTFPIAPSDPAHQYDPNPNSIQPKVVDVQLPLEPAEAASPSCVPMGAIGVLKNGVYLYNAVDAAGGDAVAHETQDVCNGHPDGRSFYHYHNVPSCIVDASPVGTATLVGYALDGYGIYLERDSNGDLPTNADLDACHGRTSAVPWEGAERLMYHYSATREFPYTIGCFRGTPVDSPDHEE
jgi:YHYH protein